MTTPSGETIDYIEATIGDIELANRLADRFLERSFAELPERTNVLLEQIIGGVQNLAEFQIIELFEVRFTRKDVRRWSTFGDTQLKQHLARLVDYEYLKAESGGHSRTIVYSLAYDPKSDTTTKDSGLVDVKRLRVSDQSRGMGGAETLKVGPETEMGGPAKTESANENIERKQNDATNDENEQQGAA